jgi:hypothetical protein
LYQRHLHQVVAKCSTLAVQRKPRNVSRRDIKQVSEEDRRRQIFNYNTYSHTEIDNSFERYTVEVKNDAISNGVEPKEKSTDGNNNTPDGPSTSQTSGTQVEESDDEDVTQSSQGTKLSQGKENLAIDVDQ